MTYSKLKKIISVSVITACIFTGPLGVVSNAQKPDKVNKGVKVEKKMDKKQWEERKESVEIDKDRLEEIEKHLKEKVEDDFEVYKETLKALEKNKVEKKILKEERKRIKQEMKALMKKRYSDVELKELEEKREEIETENEDVKVIPVENILTNRKNLKFDTPPVIKAGRTLIPVRAITEGFGAEVSWDPEERKVTITKDDVEMVLQLSYAKVRVNGVEKEIDVPAQLMNNRTIVPLRFIVENLGLKVDYDGDTGTIEIDEEENDEVIVEDLEEEVIVEELDDETDEEEVVVEDLEEENDDTDEDTITVEDLDEEDQESDDVEEDQETDEGTTTTDVENADEDNE